MDNNLSWRQALRTNFTHLPTLLDFLEVEPSKRALCLALPPFSLNLPKRLAAKIKKNDVTDPLFLQFIPLVKEQEEAPGFTADPVEDKSFSKTPKLLHKYPGRALLLVTSACAMHCRFCFRQNFPYQTYDKSFDNELSYIRENPTIHEVILSGGDPLSLGTKTLTPLLKALDAIDHVKLIRFHTRFIVGIPERITANLLSALQSLSTTLTMVIHINHASEIDEDVKGAINKLKKAGITLLSQSVLLSGVNNSKSVLKQLFLKITYAGITPYYLHRLDKVKGSSHFNSDKKKAKEWLSELRDEMPGYSVPRFVHEIPHKMSKTLI